MKKLFASLIMLMLCITVCHAEDLKAIRNGDVTILFDDGLENAAEAAVKIYPDVRKDLERITGWKVDFSPTIYFVKDHERFLQMAGHSLVVGYALPEKLFIVIDSSKVLSGAISLSSIMKHELCHLLLHKNITGDNLPKWLDEGVSQWVSGGLADIVMADSFVDRGVVTNRLIPFRYISRDFPPDNESLMLAYAQSKSIVDYMAVRFNADGIQALLNSMKEGNDIETAVHRTFGISFDGLEKNWYSTMEKKTAWLALIISHLYEILFFLAAISLIFAYVKTVIRKRAMQEDEDDPGE